jgi:lysozyme
MIESFMENNMTLRVPPGPETVNGIDISHWTPVTSWQEVKATGIGFVIMKASDGSIGVDPSFKSNWAACDQWKIKRGAYHFFHPDQDPIAQAKHFLGLVLPISIADFPLILDFENHGGVNPNQQIVSALSFLNQVEVATNQTPIIYCSPGFINDIGNPPAFSRFPLWVANYEVTAPSVPKPWSNWKMWQKASNGKCPGITGDVDLNIFNGNLSQLSSF